MMRFAVIEPIAAHCKPCPPAYYSAAIRTARTRTSGEYRADASASPWLYPLKVWSLRQTRRGSASNPLVTNSQRIAPSSPGHGHERSIGRAAGVEFDDIGRPRCGRTPPRIRTALCGHSRRRAPHLANPDGAGPPTARCVSRSHHRCPRTVMLSLRHSRPDRHRLAAWRMSSRRRSASRFPPSTVTIRLRR